ncbi:hypothetical protein M0D21_22945, partial [Aquimarina sp. D1M17]|nr:hypothetical protein [Aquimarina acroporae]
SLATTNFNVELFDGLGNELFSGLFMGSNGHARGNIKIDSNWESGDYYIRVSTNWMNNFIENDASVSKIKLINSERLVDRPADKIGYDFQLLPEGGHLVSDTENTVGFKLVNAQGLGVTFDEGFVLDEAEKVVVAFSSNSLGMGKFDLTPLSGKEYRARVILKGGEEVSGVLPKINTKGLSIQVDNEQKDSLQLTLNTNRATLRTIKSQLYYLLVHQNQR